MSSKAAKPVRLNQSLLERTVHETQLQKFMESLPPLVKFSLHTSHQRARKAAERGQLANFTIGNFILVVCEKFYKEDKLSLRRRGPRHIIKALSNYFYQVEDLGNGQLTGVHETRKFYSNVCLDAKAILPHIFYSETGMQIPRLFQLTDGTVGLRVLIRWCELLTSEETLEPLKKVYEDVPKLLVKKLDRTSTPADLASRARRELGLPQREF